MGNTDFRTVCCLHLLRSLRPLPCSPLLLWSSLVYASGFRKIPVSFIVLHFLFRRPTVVQTSSLRPLRVNEVNLTSRPGVPGGFYRPVGALAHVRGLAVRSLPLCSPPSPPKYRA